VRSDGRAFTFGLNSEFQSNVPPLPPGQHYVEVAGGVVDAAALRSDGNIVVWGYDGAGLGNVPPLPPGLRYQRVEIANVHVTALRSDGQVIVWGSNIAGQLNVPPLPSGMTYTEIATGNMHGIALRSDGAVVVWGAQNTVRLPRNGVRYVEAAGSGDDQTIVRLSDGTVENLTRLNVVPPLPPGLTYVEIAAGQQHFLARRSDGSVVAWGRNDFGQCNVPPLPAGLSYVDVEAGKNHSVARRSDGSVVAWGDDTYSQLRLPYVEPGWTMRQIACGADFTIALLAPGGFAWSGAGCAGTGGVTRLQAIAAPRVGVSLEVELQPAPPLGATLLVGFANTTSPFGPLPLDLGPLGMPGCALRVSPDVAVPLRAGAARATLPIPANPALIDLLVHVQAVVADPAANALGVVMSDAATARLGE
jgi:hypothetical protein